MHIGFIIYGDLDTLTGGYLYDRKLVEYLTAQGDQVEVISLPWQNYVTHLTHNFSAELRHHLQTGGFDVLIQDELNHPSLVWLNRQIRAHVDYPIVSFVHLLRSHEKRARWKNWFYRLIERQYLQTADGFIYNSATTQQMTEALVGRAPPAVVAPPAGNRFADFQSRIPDLEAEIRYRATSSRPFRILFVGNLIPRKGLHVLLDALDKIEGDYWKLDVVGSEEFNLSYALAMQGHVARSTWAKQVRFWGALNHDQLAERFTAGHLFVLPSSYEGFGIVYLEAMGFGLPIVGTTAGAAPEIITAGHDGFLIAPGDADHLADIINSLKTNRHLLVEMGQNALAHYRRHPTWEESCGRIRAFLLELRATDKQPSAPHDQKST